MPVETPAAHSTPRSQNSHSFLFSDRIAARSPGCSPSAMRPEPMTSAASPSRPSASGPNQSKPSSSRHSVPGSIHQIAPEIADGWIPVTSTGMTRTGYFHVTALSPPFGALPALLAAHCRFLVAQIELAHVLVLDQLGAGALEHDAPDLQHIAIMRRLQRHVGILLDQQHGHLLLLVEAADDAEDLLDQD